MSEWLSYEGYALVFEDRFEGDALDRSKWNVELHAPGWVNEELQEYVDTEEVLSLEDGLLSIRPVKTVRADGGLPIAPVESPPRESMNSPTGFLRPA